MYLVSTVGESLSQRAAITRTHWGCDLLASFSQLPTEFLTYIDASERSGSRIGKPISGLSLSIEKCEHHTPHGRVISAANRRNRSLRLPVQGTNDLIAFSGERITSDLNVSQAISRNPECESSANCLIQASFRANVVSFICPTTIAAHSRTTSLAWPARNCQFSSPTLIRYDNH